MLFVCKLSRRHFPLYPFAGAWPDLTQLTTDHSHCARHRMPAISQSKPRSAPCCVKHLTCAAHAPAHIKTSVPIRQFAILPLFAHIYIYICIILSVHCCQHMRSKASARTCHYTCLCTCQCGSSHCITCQIGSICTVGTHQLGPVLGLVVFQCVLLAVLALVVVVLWFPWWRL